MANDTTLTITGNLTRDPELRYTPSGAAWVRFAIASTPRRLDRESGKWIDSEPLFLDATAWREFAEQITESLTKGMRVVATGRLRQRSWTTDDGQKRTAFELDLEDIGPSLRWATATVTKTTRTDRRSNEQPPPPNDPWAAAPATVGATAGVNGSAAGTYQEPRSYPDPGAYKEPPF
jgi:single-strand DNA-binding protein